MRASLHDVRLSHEPYANLTASSFYDAEAMAQVLSWCETQLPWERVVTWYYQIYRCMLLLNGKRICPSPGVWLPPVFGPASLAALADQVGHYFGVALSPDVDVAVNMMVPGQWLGSHNDYDLADPPTYRMAVWLNHGWSPGMGGQTLVLGGKREGDVHRALEPWNNHVWIFETSHCSYHAIRPVVAGVRYTVAYEFRAQ
jgi:hypothetical protein